MNRAIIIITLTILTFCTSAVAGDVNNCNPLSWNALENECLYKINEFEFHIFSNGKLDVVISKKVVVKQKIILPGNFYLESVNHEIDNNKILFIFGTTDGDSGSSVLALFNKQEMKIVWQTEIGAFNISAPLIADNAIYIGAIGTVAKVDRNNGAIIWRHKHLYESDTGAFNSFMRPVRERKLIKFVENKAPRAKYSGNKEIVVDDFSGEIISK